MVITSGDDGITDGVQSEGYWKYWKWVASLALRTELRHVWKAQPGGVPYKQVGALHRFPITSSMATRTGI